MEFYKRMQIGSLTVAEGGVVSVSLARGDIIQLEVVLIAAVASAAVTLATVYLRNNTTLTFRIRGGESNTAPTIGSTERRKRPSGRPRRR